MNFIRIWHLPAAKANMMKTFMFIVMCVVHLFVLVDADWEEHCSIYTDRLSNLLCNQLTLTGNNLIITNNFQIITPSCHQQVKQLFVKSLPC